MLDRKKRHETVEAMVQQANDVQPLTGELAIAVAYWVHAQHLIMEASDPQTNQLLRDLALRPALESLLRAHAIARDPQTVAAIVSESVGPWGRGRWFAKKGFLRADDDRRAAHQESMRDWSEALSVGDVAEISFNDSVLQIGIEDRLWEKVESARQQLSHLQIHPSIDAIRVYLDSGPPPRLVAEAKALPLAQQTVATIAEVAALADEAVSEYVTKSTS